MNKKSAGSSERKVFKPKKFDLARDRGAVGFSALQSPCPLRAFSTKTRSGSKLRLKHSHTSTKTINAHLILAPIHYQGGTSISGEDGVFTKDDEQVWLH